MIKNRNKIWYHPHLGFDIEGEGEVLHLYGVGAGFWCWMELEDEE